MTDQYTPTPDDLELFKKIAQLRYSNEQLRPEKRQRAFDHFEHMLNAIESAAEQRGAEAALLCVDEPSWEHHDQTDGFPCTNCLNKAQKSIDRYRADQMEGDV